MGLRRCPEDVAKIACTLPSPPPLVPLPIPSTARRVTISRGSTSLTDCGVSVFGMPTEPFILENFAAIFIAALNTDDASEGKRVNQLAEFSDRHWKTLVGWTMHLLRENTTGRFLLPSSLFVGGKIWLPSQAMFSSGCFRFLRQVCTACFSCPVICMLT